MRHPLWTLLQKWTISKLMWSGHQTSLSLETLPWVLLQMFFLTFLLELDETINNVYIIRMAIENILQTTTHLLKFSRKKNQNGDFDFSLLDGEFFSFIMYLPLLSLCKWFSNDCLWRACKTWYG
jgi:hypothetical protein